MNPPHELFVRLFDENIMTGPVVLSCITYVLLLTFNAAAVRLFENASLHTWEDAVIECKQQSKNIETDFDTITTLNIPDKAEFWLPKYTAVTPWIDIIGCYDRIDLNPCKRFNTSSLGTCQEVCASFPYFGFNESCICVEKAHLEVRSSPCQSRSTSEYTVYKVTERTYVNISDDLCKTGKCEYQANMLYVPLKPFKTMRCNQTNLFKSICRNGKENAFSSSKKVSLLECTNYHNSYLPFLDQRFCNQYHDKALTEFWLSSFRERYIGLQSYTNVSKTTETTKYTVMAVSHSVQLDKSTDMSKTTETTKRTTIAASHSAQLDKSKDLSTSFLKTTETTKRSVLTSHSVEHNKTAQLSTGSIVGAVFGAVIFIVTLIILGIWMRIRRRPGNSNDNGNHKEQYSKDIDDNRGIIILQENKNLTVNLENSSMKNRSTDIYAVVNKKNNWHKRIDLEETYIHAPDGEYDSLISFGNRRIVSNENDYDSNLGIRNQNDPTYFTSNFGLKSDERGNDVYDHSFAAIDKNSDNLYSAALTIQTVNNNDIKTS